MKFEVKLQESYSRGELLLRFLFGWLYILVPHGFLLFFAGIWGFILQIVAFFAVLFTGVYPRFMFEYQVGLMRWNLRVSARWLNVADGYPSFGLKGTDENTMLEVEYPERLSRGLLLLRLFFGIFYVLIPHGFILYFRTIFVFILIFLAWFAVLFTGKYPKGFFEWVVGLLRWQTRVSLYMGFMTDKYPAFTGHRLPEEI